MGGLREDQTLFIRKSKKGIYYGAFFPWQKQPENTTIHLGFISNKVSAKDYKQLENTTKSKVLNEKIVDELDTGSETKVRALGMAAFLQMAELEKTTCTLTVKRGGQVGYLYIYKGDLTYAETYSLKNQEAAHEIIN